MPTIDAGLYNAFEIYQHYLCGYRVVIERKIRATAMSSSEHNPPDRLQA